jgi:hypothetical protein
VELAKEFETDSVAANARFKNQWVLVEGPVEDADSFASGSVLVRLAGYKGEQGKRVPGHAVRCDFVPADTGKLLDLTRGQRLKLRGLCTGDSGSSFVDLHDCEAVEVGPDPSVVVSAVQLTKDYDEDGDAAEAKYRDKPLRVEGVVLERRRDDGRPRVVLEGFDETAPNPLRVAALYPAERQEEFASLKKGDKVRVKGVGGGNFLGEIQVRAARRLK